MPRAELEKLVRKFMTPLQVVRGQDDLVEKLKAFDFESGKKLADLLLEDVLPVVPEGVTIVVSPDDCLGALPFEMLTLNGEGRIQETAGLPRDRRGPIPWRPESRGLLPVDYCSDSYQGRWRIRPSLTIACW